MERTPILVHDGVAFFAVGISHDRARVSYAQRLAVKPQCQLVVFELSRSRNALPAARLAIQNALVYVVLIERALEALRLQVDLSMPVRAGRQLRSFPEHYQCVVHSHQSHLLITQHVSRITQYPRGDSNSPLSSF